MSQFASVADYQAALDADKSAAAGHYAAEVAKAEAEAQQAKDAARYRWLRDRTASVDWSVTYPMLQPNVTRSARYHRVTADGMDRVIDLEMAKEQ